ncbi:Biotin/lipoate A/B protein ligase [Irineochytrium annulatum]|nr:Biotin/lipoate A/B protein ligase [Irineochytrium annulatum]
MRTPLARAVSSLASYPAIPADVPSLDRGPFTMDCYISRLTDPWANLALEDWLFRRPVTASPSHTLFFYRNDPCVVIGRNQVRLHPQQLMTVPTLMTLEKNPWRECNVPLLRASNTALVRRRSGGGTVYHDQGNMNYSIMLPRDMFSRRLTTTLVARSLHELDIPGQVNERHDVVVADRKVSGSAFKVVRDRCYHHGTMLIDSDLGSLGRLLRPSPLVEGGMEGKGVRSVRSPVGRLREHSMTATGEDFAKAVAKVVGEYYGVGSPSLALQELGDSDIDAMTGVRAGMEELKTWEWTYGETPEFTFALKKRLEIGDVSIEMLVKGGVVKSVTTKQPADEDVAEIIMRVILDGGVVGGQFGDCASRLGALRFSDRLIEEVRSWLARSMRDVV